MRTLTIIALLLVVIGAINWGLIGFFGFNLVAAIFGTSPAGVAVERIIYALVGLAGVYGTDTWQTELRQGRCLRTRTHTTCRTCLTWRPMPMAGKWVRTRVHFPYILLHRPQQFHDRCREELVTQVVGMIQAIGK